MFEVSMISKPFSFLAACMTAAAFVTCASAGDLPPDNPFASPSPLVFQTPQFDRIRDEHFRPAFLEGMRLQLAEMEAITAQQAEPTFENTITAIEKSGALLTRVRNVFSNLTSSHKNDALQAIETELAPLQAAHSDNILLNRSLFARVSSLWDRREQLGLTTEQQEVLQQHYEGFVRAGARLTDEQQVRIRALNEKISLLETKFEENLLALLKERSVVVDSVAELDGMSELDISAAAEIAKARGLSGKYVIEISNTTRVPILTSLNNRALRQRVWEASAWRGLGRNGGLDNRPLVLELAKLRAERAQLLGFDSHAAFKLQNQMAQTPDAARKMLTDLAPGVMERVRQEARDLEQMMRASGATHELAPWDWEYYAEKLRKARFDVDESQVKPYFELNSVLENGVFHTMNLLHGVQFRERTDLPIFHPDVRVFDVLEKDGTQIGLFFFDPFRRETKRGGAWMSSFVDQSGLLQERPVVVNTLNIPRPGAGEPALVSFDNVVTLFHEMGHGLHGLFSDVTYPSVAGTNTPRDFVEFPSTFQEDWAIQPAILANYARHYKTGERIPAELLERVVKASRFNQGFDTLEYLAAAILDLEWHSLTPDQVPTDVEAFEAATLKKYGVDHPAVPPRYRTPYFAHIWSGGYSSSYYAYIWSEVLAADAFAFMQKQGGATAANGEKFRREVLSKGSSRDPMESYRAFRGGAPTVEGLLIRRGLK
ncbi:MAG: M3 family metallopeptidase [Planctomyces sp.]|jgi:peptidyl-dipeptidase Dcp